MSKSAFKPYESNMKASRKRHDARAKAHREMRKRQKERDLEQAEEAGRTTLVRALKTELARVFFPGDETVMS